MEGPGFIPNTQTVFLPETADRCNHGPLSLGYSDWARIGYMTQAGPVSLPLATFYPKRGWERELSHK